MNDPRAMIMGLYEHILRQVNGQVCVADALSSSGYRPNAVIAIGKAAASMMQGALSGLPEKALLITAPDYLGEKSFPDFVEILYSGHPIPNQGSLQAGERLIGFLRELPEDAKLLFLLSGGSSAMVESLASGVTLLDLQTTNQWLLANGYSITEINEVRRRLSRIKGGGLCHFFRVAECRAWYISDVPGDDPSVIGSGLLFPSGVASEVEGLPASIARLFSTLPTNTEPCCRDARILASASTARSAASSFVNPDFEVTLHSSYLDGDVAEVAAEIVETLRASGDGMHIWSGEPTVSLPTTPGRGGRMTALALHLIKLLAVESQNVSKFAWTALCASTDGVDGNADAAGAIVDCHSAHALRAQGIDIKEYICQARSGECLGVIDSLLPKRITGTNVTDLIIVFKQPIYQPI
ncbi:MAG: DUF4147 domain-containing protein [Gammaproteobacteria bacterium]|nr:DUF4147 domain-containing protein [Gammaproteobacteria bacterium]